MSITSSPKSNRTTVAVLAVIAAWLAAALAIGAAGVFSVNGEPVALGLAAVLPPAVVVALLTWAPWFQAWVRGLDLKLLVHLQMWRIGGYAILGAWGVGALPGGFAIPAGLGDTFVAIAAPFVAAYLVRPGGRSVFLAWTAFGIADLVSAIALGILHMPEFGPLATASSNTDAMGDLPLVFIPTFGVPLTLSLHFVALYNARMAQATPPAVAPATAPALARHA